VVGGRDWKKIHPEWEPVAPQACAPDGILASRTSAANLDKVIWPERNLRVSYRGNWDRGDG